MAFDGFYIKLSSIAKLPHTDTYYACFEYKNKYKDKFNITDTLASSCIVNFNNSIFASKSKPENCGGRSNILDVLNVIQNYLENNNYTFSANKNKDGTVTGKEKSKYYG